jgi:hypothetical protein
MAEEKTEASKLNGADITVALRKAVIANGEEVKELKFREPTAGDIDRAGNPVLLDMFSDPPKITFDAKAMTTMMAALAAVPPSTIKQMHPKDWNTAAWQLAGFFMPEL